jgi:hypothetical protein
VQPAGSALTAEVRGSSVSGIVVTAVQEAAAHRVIEETQSSGCQPMMRPLSSISDRRCSAQHRCISAWLGKPSEPTVSG